jgi:hypothetical protein
MSIARLLPLHLLHFAYYMACRNHRFASAALKSFPRRILMAALGALLGATWSIESIAWSMGGHRVTGVIAAREIAATAPRVIDAVTVIMQAHPAADAFLARVNEAGADPFDRLERLFAEMAQWPDEVRSGPLKHFHRGSWHTIDIPFVVPGFTPAPATEFSAENLLSALHENARIAADTAASASDRAVALCWIFHLVGDLHQPLHAASLYSPAFPNGDRYGTQFWVRLPGGNETVSLHYFWDSLIQRSQNTSEVLRTASHLLNTYAPAMLEEMRERPYRGPDMFDRWAREESYRLAIRESYRDGRLAGAADKKAAPRLPEDYAANAHALAARRMALSGYRLAEVLRALFQ